MKKTEPSYNDKDIRAYLEEGCEFEGKLNFSGVVRLNGRFRGDIDSEDTLIVSETAIVEGNIRVGLAVIGGRVNGDITSKHCTEILATGNIDGSITSPLLITHEGAQIQGHITIHREVPNMDLAVMPQTHETAPPQETKYSSSPATIIR